MFKNINLLFFLLLMFSACSVKESVTWQKRIIQSNNSEHQTDLIYTEYGNKSNKTLLFLHGFGESKETWRFLVPVLSQKFHLVLLDLKGFGQSPKLEDDAYSVYDQAREVASFIKKKKLENVTVVGRSFGGGVALVLALMQKEKLMAQSINRLILINSMSYRQGLPSMLETLNQPIIGFLGIHLLSNDYMAEEAYKFAFYNNELIPKDSLEYASYCLSMPLAKYVYLETTAQLVPDDIEKIEQRYKDIDLPTLILWGKEDVSIHVDKAYRLHRDIKYSKLKIFPKVGHMPNEEAPQKVLDEILKFMEKSW